ncbi:MAG TPA: hypothetical protein VIN05_10640 [Roseovarius sp.]
MPISLPTPKKAQSPKTATSPAPQSKRSAPRKVKVKTKPQVTPRLIFNDFASI